MQLVSRGVTLFTMFYCTLNWWLYRKVLEDYKTAKGGDDEEDDDDGERREDA